MDEPWGEERADMRQVVLVDTLMAAFSKNGHPNLRPMWPYSDMHGVDLDEVFRFQRLYAAALEDDGKGGQRLTRPYEDIRREARQAA